ncbi:MAG: hypothetical protein ACK5SQ_02530 [Chitinophagales bacterium]
MSDILKIKQVEGLSTSLEQRALDSLVLKKANNLSELEAGPARTNLSVYSRAEVDALIVGARDAYNVADTTARNALTGLKVTDRVFVNNDGDSKWALYLVTAVTNGAGSTSTFKKIADEDLFTNALTAAAVKAAYESNADTYVYNGVAKGKVDKITVTANVNLDELSDLASDSFTTATEAQTAANAAASAATAAQTTANSAVTAAAAAQTMAEGKEEAFTQATQQFTNINGLANVNVPLTLSNAPKAGFIVEVYINGIRVRNVIYAAGNPTIAYNVPYVTESSDHINVVYCY